MILFSIGFTKYLTSINPHNTLSETCRDFSNKYYYYIERKDNSSTLSDKKSFALRLKMSKSFNDYRSTLLDLEKKQQNNELSSNESLILDDHIKNKLCTPYWDYKEKFLTKKQDV